MTTNTQIKLLPPLVANQIAAGEVIERPASILKELLENSIDAGAQAIDIQLENGGIDLVRVCDDGSGIAAEQLQLAITNHATSKISSVNDLFEILSLGFRGEALASIAAVTRFECQSRTANSQDGLGAVIKAQNGVIEQATQPIAHPIGTTIQAKDLFFNLPARRKFLRQPRTEWQYCESLFKAMALSNMNIAFRVSHNGKLVYQLPKVNDESGKQQRIKRLIGKQFIDNAISINAMRDGIQLTGYLLAPEQSRSSNDWQYCFLNGRLLKDKLLRHAIKAAFADLLYPGRQPGYVLDLTVDPKQVDVNVHPTKHEVRFREGRWVHDFLTSSIREALTQSDNIDNNHHQDKHNDGVEVATDAYDVERASIDAVSKFIYEPKPKLGPRPDDHGKDLFVKPTSHTQAAIAANLVAAPQVKNKESNILGVFAEKFLLLELEKQHLKIIDLDFAQQFIITKQWQQQIANKTITSKPLLLPEMILVNKACLAAMQDKLDLLQAVGFKAELAKNNLVIRAMPSLLTAINIAKCCRALVDAENNIDNIMQSVLASLKANTVMQFDSAALDTFMQQFANLNSEQQQSCYIILDSEQLAKLFTSQHRECNS